MLISTLINDVRLECSGALDIVIERALFLSASEFFRRTKAWRINNEILVSPANNTDGSVNYTVTLPADTLYENILGVRQGTIKVSPIDQYRLRSGRVIPSRITRINMDSVNNGTPLSQTVFITDDVMRQSPILVSYSIVPTSFTTNISDEVMLRWSEEIQRGAKFRLFNMANANWRDSQASQENYLLFETGIARASVFSSEGESGSPIRTKAFA